MIFTTTYAVPVLFHWGNTRVILELHWDNGKRNGNYMKLLFRFKVGSKYPRVVQELST